MIKIASLVPYKIIPPVKGGDWHIYKFLKNVSAHANVTCFTVRENTAIDHISVKNILGSTRNVYRYINVRLYFTIKAICRRQNIRHIILEHPYYGWLGYGLKVFNNMHLIVRSHNIESLRFRTLGKWWWRILFFYEKWVHQIADLNLFITEDDRVYAIDKFNLKPAKCMVSTYGIEASLPSANKKLVAKNQVCFELGIPVETKIILFNGSLNYKPNTDAVKRIIDFINPSLNKKLNTPYKIIICGKALPKEYIQLLRTNNTIFYTGFVTDIHKYILGSDIFINPVTDGGGIKTKLVEALATNTSAVSFVNGAYGIPKEVVGDKLKYISNEDYEGFIAAIIHFINNPVSDIPEVFYEYFRWNHIAKKTIEKIKSLT